MSGATGIRVGPIETAALRLGDERKHAAYSGADRQRHAVTADLQQGAILETESERGCILVGGAIVDEALTAILLRIFSAAKPSDINGPNKPLGGFSSKSLLARGLEIITETEFRDAEIIRKIRNKAAHQLGALGALGDVARGTFADETIASQCRELSQCCEHTSLREAYILTVSSVSGTIEGLFNGLG